MNIQGFNNQQNNVTRNNVTGNNARRAGNRPMTLGNLPTPGIINDVKVNISDEARRLFLNMQEGNENLVRLPEISEMAEESLTQFFSHENFAALAQSHSREAITFLSQAHFATGGTAPLMEFFSLENAAMAEMGHKLSSVINANKSNLDNFVALGNKYAEIRESLEAMYSGEELESQLNKLSEAFDLTAQILAHERSTSAFLQMRFEQARTVLNNQLFNQNTEIEYDEEKISNIRNSTRFFAQLTRQFILENGAITSEHDKESLLEMLLNESGRINQI
ncbi:MAG: hypothetical protein FWF81_08770 [Defluviitaleaceae bacterium]|nr:hypothetical protein [Defluviitaleaceae bacterium]